MKVFRNFFWGLLLFSCGSASQQHQSQWHSTLKDAPAAIFHPENALTLSVSNDVDFLYIEIASTSLRTIEKIQKLGLSIWVNKGVLAHKTHGIHYPLPYENTEGKVALEGFWQEPLVALPLAETAPLQLALSILPKNLLYTLQLPLSELALAPKDKFTVSISSFAAGKQEYLESLTTAEEIERRLDAYKANPQYFYAKNELVPFFTLFELAKKPSKNQ